MMRRWKKAAWLALGCLAPLIAGAADPQGSEANWTSLFDGQSIEGWTAIPLG